MSARFCLVMGLTAMVLSGGSEIAAAEDPVAVAEGLAKGAAATPEGKKYEDAVATAFGRDQVKAIQSCARAVKRPDLSDFQVFVQVSAAGEVEEAFVKPNTNLAACLQGKLKGWKVIAPPQANSWVNIQVKLKAK